MSKEYKLVTGDYDQSMEDKVNELLKDGWDFHGPTSFQMIVGDEYSSEYYCQAMVKGNSNFMGRDDFVLDSDGAKLMVKELIKGFNLDIQKIIKEKLIVTGKLLLPFTIA